MKKIVDMEEWEKFYDEKMDDLYPYEDEWEDGHKDCLEIVNEWLQAQPDADKKRGKWRKSGYEEWACSCCNEYVCIGEGYDTSDCMLYYCPNCGAKMDL